MQIELYFPGASKPKRFFENSRFPIKVTVDPSIHTIHSLHKSFSLFNSKRINFLLVNHRRENIELYLRNLFLNQARKQEFTKLLFHSLPDKIHPSLGIFRSSLSKEATQNDQVCRLLLSLPFFYKLLNCKRHTVLPQTTVSGIR